MNRYERKEQLLTEPIPKLIRSIGIPAAIGFLFNTMFNVVDTWYAGMLSTRTLAALSLSFPVFFLIIAFSGGFSVGITAIVGNEFGAGRDEQGRIASRQALLLSAFIGLLLTFLGEAVSPPLFRILGAKGDYLDSAVLYMRVIFAGTIFFMLNNAINGVLRAHGDTRSYRNFLILGSLLNLLLDPLFIFGWLGLPKMGIAGVALATIIIQAFGTLYMALRLLSLDTRLESAEEKIDGGFERAATAEGQAQPGQSQPGKTQPRQAPARQAPALKGQPAIPFLQKLKPDLRVWKELLDQGIPATLNSLTVGAGIFVITWFIGRFGEAAVAAYGAAVRIEQIALLPTIGISTAVLSITARNCGAGKLERIEETEVSALKHGLILLIPALIFLIAAPSLLSFFSDDPEVIAPGALYLRIDALTLYAYILLFVHVSMLQGLKRPKFAIGIGLFRQILVPVPLFWLLSGPVGLGLSGVFWGILIVTWSAALIAFFFGRRFLKKNDAKIVEK
jgi:Na+-driven multidrug efflux pump